MKNNSINRAVIVFTIVSAIIALSGVIYQFLLPLFLLYKYNIDLNNSCAIGIIGGAAGPSSVFLSYHSFCYLITPIAIFITILGVIYQIYLKRKQK